MQTDSVDSQMKTTNDSDYGRKMIQYIREMQEVILKIPELSSKQKDDIIKFRERLEDLDLQTDDTKVKRALIDVMISLN